MVKAWIEKRRKAGTLPEERKFYYLMGPTDQGLIFSNHYGNAELACVVVRSTAVPPSYV